MKNKFLRDLDAGTKGEKIVMELFAQHGLPCSKTPNYDFHKDNWDLQVELACKPVWLEVKYDLYSGKSGNVAIELYNPKRCCKSGLTSTEAHLWIHILTNPHSVMIANVGKLKKFCVDNAPHKLVSCGGDDNSTMYLYRIDVIQQVFERIDNIEKSEDFLQTIAGVLNGNV